MAYRTLTAAARTLGALKILRQAPPIQTVDLAERLGISVRSTEELLAEIREANVGLTSERRGREIWHHIGRLLLALFLVLLP